MREAEFREWLEARRWNGKPLTSISSRMSKARRFEKAMPALGFAQSDLDVAFDADGMEEVTARLRDWCRDSSANGTAPIELVGDTTNAAMRISNVASAVRNYRQFREADDASPSAWPELEELRAIFLDRVPEFERFDRTDNEYERVERSYKDEIMAEVRAVAASADTDQEAGRRIYRALIPNQGGLLSWQIDDDFARKFPALEGQFDAIVGRLARDLPPSIDAIMAAADAFEVLHHQGASSLTIGQIARIALTVRGMVHPDDAAPFAITKAQRLAKLVTGDPIFTGSALHREQVERWLELLRRIETVMRDEWHWHPRDLMDVQGFAWVALDDRWGGDDDMDDDALLARFDGNPLFRALRDSWNPEQSVAFCSIARAVHDAGLDWYHTNHARTPVRFGRKSEGATTAYAVQGYLLAGGSPRIALNGRGLSLGVDEVMLDADSASDFASTLAEHADAIANWFPPKPPRQGRWPNETGVEAIENGVVETAGPINPTNLILYGPPGTGKTFATAEHAVRLCGEKVPEGRVALMATYRRLVEDKRIEFVTFHQSMAYEEFVEGLRPTTGSGVEGDADISATGGFRLAPRDGIFKQISERARLSETAGITSHLDRQRVVFKIALGRRGEEEDRISDGLDHGLIHLGWGGDIDWSDERFDTFEPIRREWNETRDPDASGKDPNIEMMYTFRAAMQPGDYVILSDGRDLVRGVGEITGEYFYDDAATYHPHRRPVRWLWQDAAGVARDRFYPRQFRRHSTYQLTGEAIDWDALDQIVFGHVPAAASDALPHVLVIDEINRANISKVFGELITLLEPDKRLGKVNELKVRLPYSGDGFGVPANLHIIGTMNTADRSIALIDKALRRRFAFTEMMPDYDVPGMEVEVAGADVTLAEMLRTINDRIEYLLDREHQIGHGWLLGCDTKTKLDAAMREKVIPLIAEYFFEDWGRTADVLGGREDNPFLKAEKLAPPPGLSEEQPRIRWVVRGAFDADAYTRLIG